MNRSRFWFLTALALVAAVTRIVPHPDNFSPMAAVTLFSAATFSRRWVGAAVAFGALLLSDLLLHLTYQPGGWQPNWGFYRGQWVVYACLVPTVLLGFAIRTRRNFPMIAVATLANAVVFFAVTNFSVWANGSGLTYPKTAEGLMACYVAAIPFFERSLMGDACFVTVLFGTLALAESRIRAIRSVEETPGIVVQPTV